MNALDLETTDVDPRRDRVITASLVTIIPTGIGKRPDVTITTWLADPGIEIPEDATAIHGITTEQARRDGRPAAEVIGEISELLGKVWAAEIPLCAFNAAFDLTMLDAELRRHHERGLDLAGPVIDPLCIDRRLDPHRDEKRTLANLCKHYNVRLDDAHTSAGDALATARLAWRLAAHYPERVGQLTPCDLHGQQTRWFHEQQHAYAEKIDSWIRRDTARGSNPDKIARLAADAADTRAAAGVWPLLPLTSEPAPSPRRRVLPPRPGGPAKSHATWTPDLEGILREDWLTATPSTDAETLRAELAVKHGRSIGAIRARLLKLMCDPELSGQTCNEQRAAHLAEIYAAEYARNQKPTD